MPPARPLLLFSAFLLLAGCHKAPAPAPEPDRAQLIEQRKDAAIGQLADCESGQGGGGSRYVGRLQSRTVINYVKERDGRTLSTREAVALANDYGQASSLAKYMIFERGAHTQWPACSRKIGLAQQVAEIRAL